MDAVIRTSTDGPRRRRLVQIAFGALISLLFLYAALSAAPVHDLLDALKGVQPAWLLLAIASIGCAYTAKIMRWTLMLRRLGADVDFREAAIPLLGGVALNNVLPFRAGDIVRIVAFRRLTRLSPLAQAGTLLVERVLDVMVLCAIFFVTLQASTIYSMDRMLINAVSIATGCALLGISVMVFAPRPLAALIGWIQARHPMVGMAAGLLLRVVDAMSALSTPIVFFRLLGVSVIAWLAEAGAFLAVGLSLGIGSQLEPALLGLSAGTLSTVVPSAPGYVGTFHYFTAMSVAAFGIEPAIATAYAILVHGVLWVVTTGAGFLMLGLSGFGREMRIAAEEVS